MRKVQRVPFGVPAYLGYYLLPGIVEHWILRLSVLSLAPAYLCAATLAAASTSPLPHTTKSLLFLVKRRIGGEKRRGGAERERDWGDGRRYVKRAN
jgi:hypothetical protein